jgi:hypothetical protein
MLSDDKLFHSIKQLNAQGAADAVRRSLIASSLPDALSFFENFLSKIRTWVTSEELFRSKLHNILYYHDLLKTTQNSLSDCIAMCEERAKQEIVPWKELHMLLSYLRSDPHCTEDLGSMLAMCERHDRLCNTEWWTLRNALCELRTVPNGIENLDSIIEICESRAELEKDAIETLLPAGLRLWRTYGHLNSEFLWRELKPVLSAESGRPYHFDQLRDKYGRIGMWGLYDTVKYIVINDCVDEPHPLETWLDFLFQMSAQKPIRSSLKYDNKEDSNFGRCEFCWRIVYHRDVTGQGRYFCHLHQRNSAEYRKIKKLEKAANHLPEFNDWKQKGYRSLWHYLKEKSKKYHRSVKKEWRLDRSNLPEGWTVLMENDVLELHRQVTNTVTYPYEHLIHHFPAVVRYVKQQGGVPQSPLSLLQALNPEPPDESYDIRQKRRARLEIFANNLVLYRLDLCEAQVILDAYEQLGALK